MLFGSLSDIDLYETMEDDLKIKDKCQIRKAMIVDHTMERPGYLPYEGDLNLVYFYDSSSNNIIKYYDKYLKTSGILVCDFDAFIMSAKVETDTANFREWAGDERVTLAIVFTDIVSSTAMGEKLRDEAMSEIRRMHFAQSRKLINRFNGREIKTIGDSFMVAFRNVVTALDYALALFKNTGHPQVQIRAGIHIGQMEVEEGDVFGGTVNFAARVVGAISGAEIWLSDRAKEDIDRLGAVRHKKLDWKYHEHVDMKGFTGKVDLWSINEPITITIDEPKANSEVPHQNDIKGSLLGKLMPGRYLWVLVREGYLDPGQKSDLWWPQGGKRIYPPTNNDSWTVRGFFGAGSDEQVGLYFDIAVFEVDQSYDKEFNNWVIKSEKGIKMPLSENAKIIEEITVKRI
jgi:class 3 adenylate cyclase